MNPSRHEHAEIMARSEFDQRQRDSYAYGGNRHERRAEAVQDRRQAKRTVQPVIQATDSTFGIIQG